MKTLFRTTDGNNTIIQTNNNMKKLILYCHLILGIVLLSCDEEPRGQQPIHHNPPGPVSEVTVENIPGGAKITYNVPVDEDFLYVKAIYTLKDGIKSEHRSSLYNNYLTIEGFGSTDAQEVELVAVDRYRNESSPVKVTVNPLTPPVLTIGESLDLVADFGGVHAYWTNPTRADVGVTILIKDHNDEFVPLETFYSSMVDGDGAARGLDVEETEFGLYVQDRWENRSETKYFTLTPIFEDMFDKNKFQAIELPGDAPKGPGGWELQKIWDGVKGENGYSSQGGMGVWPQSITFDLGIVAQISRITLYQRTGGDDGYIFAEGNPRLFQIYGSETLDMTGNWDSWTLLMDCESIKPSGLPFGMKNNEDIERAKSGENFVNSPLNPKVRYLRILVTQTWSGGDNFQISELDIWGDNR